MQACTYGMVHHSLPPLYEKVLDRTLAKTSGICINIGLSIIIPLHQAHMEYTNTVQGALGVQHGQIVVRRYYCMHIIKGDSST